MQRSSTLLTEEALPPVTRKPFSSSLHCWAWCALCCTIIGCDSKLVVGSWQCAPRASATLGTAGTSGTSTEFANWSTGFEDGFCDYSAPDGFCFVTGKASYDIVESPVHQGRYAAAFHVDSLSDVRAAQTRCVRQGALPEQAYYGAWYYIPSVSQNSGIWNLFHFQGGQQGTALQYLWDVSLINDGKGGLRTVVFSHVEGRDYGTEELPSVPIGEWFELQVFLKRDAGTSGEIAVYQNGTRFLNVSGIKTDNADDAWGQWYVGNLADSLDPPVSTVYVDDISVRTTL
ncbi:MAG TPA: hypothetical protein VKP30_18740 [Polyangiaceae bacterium]|nr:hypothetical protein [Polyangiaceae bacterium]